MQLTSLIGKKTYQKQGFLQDGRRVPLSAVNVLGNFVTQIKTKDKEGYNSVQLGIDIKKKPGKRETGHSKKAGLTNTPRFFREIRTDDLDGAVLGSEVNVSEVFQAGDMVDVTGVSKGKGFAGVVKRHGFHGGPRTHGQSDRERAPGSIGQTTTPGRVYKGKRMAGRMGQDTVTVKNLEIIQVSNDGVLLIKGLVPGSVNSVLVIKKVGENKKFVPLYKEEVEAPVKEVKTEVQEELKEEEKAEEQAKEEIKAEATKEVKEEVKEEVLSEVSAEETDGGLVSDSSESAQASDASETEKTQNEEKKEQVKEENANS